MALTIAVTPLIDVGGRGMGRKVSLIDITYDTSYAAGGYTAALGFTLPALKFRNKLEALIPCGATGLTGAGAGVVPQWDKRAVSATNPAGTLKLLGAAGGTTGLTEIANGAAISTQQGTFMAVGY